MSWLGKGSDEIHIGWDELMVIWAEPNICLNLLWCFWHRKIFNTSQFLRQQIDAFS